MAEDDRPGYAGQEDYRYFGPFGPPPDGSGRQAFDPDADRTAPLGIGSWSYPEDETTRSSQPWAASPYPAPAGVPPLQPGLSDQPTALAPPPPKSKRQLRAAQLVALAALTALLVGSAAGYGGARLAQRAENAPAVSNQPGSAGSPSSAPSTRSAPAPGASSPPLIPLPGESNLVQVARAALPSSVMIQVGDSSSGGTGSGFVLDDSGHIMTNNHVVAAAANGGQVRVVFSDGTRTTAKLVGRSPSYDLAVIKVAPSSRVKPARIGDSRTSRIGEPVIAIGSPLGLPGTVTAGIVSAKDRPVVVSGSSDADALSAYINAIQTDAPINPGNSGGPLIDAQARVIGVNSAILTLGESRAQSGSIGLGFAIPINQAMVIGEQLIENGTATYPVIGAKVGDDEAEQGVKLIFVESGGPAADAGLREGDVITTIDGRPVTEIQQLIVIIRTHRPGERVELSYQRNGSKDTTQVTLGEKEG